MDDGLVRKSTIPLKQVYASWVRNGLEKRLEALSKVEQAMQEGSCPSEGDTPMLVHLSNQHSSMLSRSLMNSGLSLSQDLRQAAAAA